MRTALVLVFFWAGVVLLMAGNIMLGIPVMAVGVVADWLLDGLA